VEISDEAYYSELDGVYHALRNCPTGRQIPIEIRRHGRGGRLDMCSACEARVEAAWNRAVDYNNLSWLGHNDPSQRSRAGKPFQDEGERMDDTREAILRPKFHDKYPSLRPDRWYPACQLAETVPKQCCPGELQWEYGSRVLSNEHFLFRGGRPRRDWHARTRRSDRLHGTPAVE
jgi:hypothetical protein